jgi:hypothetical protein
MPPLQLQTAFGCRQKARKAQGEIRVKTLGNRVLVSSNAFANGICSGVPILASLKRVDRNVDVEKGLRISIEGSRSLLLNEERLNRAKSSFSLGCG